MPIPPPHPPPPPASAGSTSHVMGHTLKRLLSQSEAYNISGGGCDISVWHPSASFSYRFSQPQSHRKGHFCCLAEAAGRWVIGEGLPRVPVVFIKVANLGCLLLTDFSRMAERLPNHACLRLGSTQALLRLCCQPRTKWPWHTSLSFPRRLNPLLSCTGQEVYKACVFIKQER